MIQHFFNFNDCREEDLGKGVRRRVLAYEKNLMAVEVSFEEGAVGALHKHPHEQISYIIDGEFEFEINGEKRVLKAGDTTFKEPGVLHGAICLKAGRILDIFTPCREDFIGGERE